MYGKIVIKILIPDGVYIGISLKHVDVWEPALLEYCLIVLIDVRRTLNKWMGLGKGHTTRARRWRDISSLKLGEYAVVFVVGDLRMVWISASRVRVPKTKLPKDLATLGTTTPVCMQTHLKRGSLLQTLCQWPFLKKDLQYETSIGSLWSYIFTSDDVITGILFSGYFAFSVLFFFYRVLDFENRIAEM